MFNHYPKGKAVYIAPGERKGEGLEDPVPGKAWKEVSMYQNGP